MTDQWKIREATEADIEDIISITKANNHFWNPDVDGAAPLRRLMEREGSMVFVYQDGDILGFVLGSYDGARAFIHKISVMPELRDNGLGTLLVERMVDYFRDLGAPSVAVAAADGTRKPEEDSIPFWRKVGFQPIPARLMILFDIQGEDDEGQ